MEYKYTGIVIAKHDVGETDRIYSIYTLEQGKVSALAKGVRKSQAKLAGFLENFTLSDISVVRRSGMGKITGSIVENNFSSMKKDYEAISRIIDSIRIFNKLVEYDFKEESLFNLLRDYLEAVDSQCLFRTVALGDHIEKIDLLSASFLVKMLDELGYSWEVRVCAKCQGKLDSEGNAFSAKEGGFVCSRCHRDSRESIMVDISVIKIIRLILQNNLKPLVKLKVNRKDLNILGIIIKESINWI